MVFDAHARLCLPGWSNGTTPVSYSGNRGSIPRPGTTSSSVAQRQSIRLLTGGAWVRVPPERLFMTRRRPEWYRPSLISCAHGFESRRRHLVPWSISYDTGFSVRRTGGSTQWDDHTMRCSSAGGAPVSEAGGRWFESSQRSSMGRSLMEECRPTKPCGAGSSPAVPAILPDRLMAKPPDFESGNGGSNPPPVTTTLPVRSVADHLALNQETWVRSPHRPSHPISSIGESTCLTNRLVGVRVPHRVSHPSSSSTGQSAGL